MSIINYPFITRKQYSNNDIVTIDTIQRDNRCISIFGEITMESALITSQEILCLESLSDEPIHILINSAGGSVEAGLLIYDVMKACHCQINTYCLGIAASMSALLFAAGSTGCRYIYKHSRTMIHEPLLLGLSGSSSSIKCIANNMTKIKNQLNEILANHTGHSLKEINKATLSDNYMSAEESVVFGMCDHIVASNKEIYAND